MKSVLHLVKMVLLVLVCLPYRLIAAECNVSIVSEWNAGFSASVTITNDSDTIIDGWLTELQFSDATGIDHMWNAMVSGEAPSYEATNQDYNRLIDVGGSVTFGFNGRKAINNGPVTLPSLSGICSESPPDVNEPAPPVFAKCEYSVVNEWGSGFTAKLVIENTNDSALSGWSVNVLYPDETRVSSAWNAQLDQSQLPNHIFKHVNYNRIVDAGASVNFGFNAQKAVSGQAASLPNLRGICEQVDIVNTPPTAVAGASVLSGFAPLSVDFQSADSADPDGDTLSYLWTFSDGTSSIEPNPNKVFTEAGEYQASLIVNDGTIDSIQASLDIVVTNPPDDTNAFLLDTSQSSLFFVSTKKEHVIETHQFTQISGGISDNGLAVLNIDLSSVDTDNATRDQRMRDFLFEVENNPSATITLNVDTAWLAGLAVGQSQTIDAIPSLDLHGFALELSTQLLVTKLSASTIIVRNTQPILVDAASFNLVTGIETLRDLANLSSISYAVPVNFTLFFVAQ